MTAALLISIIAFLLALSALIIAIRSIRKYFCKPSFERPRYSLDRHEQNPVISPLEMSEWQAVGTFNPAAVVDDEGKVHLLFRAIGSDGMSRIGHSSSIDGLNFDTRSQYPVFEPTRGYGLPAEGYNNEEPRVYNPAYYTSGGGWGGTEDPRAVIIGDRVYMSYVAFEGWNSVRIALTSIKLKDFKRGFWRWRRPMLISAPGEVAKNWVIFPEKINGKYAILHSIVPSICIDYIDSLDNITTFIKSKRLHGPQPGRKGYWDSKMRGAGPPPIKTPIGWLLLYHAIDDREPSKYKLGAMLLDLKDPTRIIYRSPQPILQPDMHYENDGKPGVVYASGAVVIGENLMIYYGGGDKHVCIAQTPLKRILDWLVMYGKL